MTYYSTTFTILPCTTTAQDILSAVLGEIGYESFVPTIDGLEAYIQEKFYSEESVIQVVNEFIMPDVQISFVSEKIRNEDWNESWEQNGFEPIIIDKLCCIHSTRHESLPQLPYDIIINPKMAFGSGSHETTCQLTRILLNEDFTGKSVLDMGCGTCVLGIAMAKKGAKEVVAIDIDENSVENARQNCKLNGVENIEIIHGDAYSIKENMKFDCIVANIHKNIIIADMSQYISHLKTGGKLIVSGFYEEDESDISKAALSKGLSLLHRQSQNKWSVMCFIAK